MNLRETLSVWIGAFVVPGFSRLLVSTVQSTQKSDAVSFLSNSKISQNAASVADTLMFGPFVAYETIHEIST